MNPTTGIAGCCALAASGHAAENGDELTPSHVEHGLLPGTRCASLLECTPWGGQMGKVRIG